MSKKSVFDEGKRSGRVVLKTHIDSGSWDSYVNKIRGWAKKRHSSYVCICNVHSVVTGHLDSDFQTVLNDADMATPDGAPVAWMLRRLGCEGQERISGPDLMWRYLSAIEGSDEAIYLYGGSESTLAILLERLRNCFPGLKIAGYYSPPFRTLTDVEDEEIVRRINESGAGTVWVSLGCPKQEVWMAKHRGRINSVMVGVGAAFDYHAGVIKRAPVSMQRLGLEWLFRLMAEPRRLWSRYWSTNTRFIALATKQLLFGSSKD